MGDKSKIEWTDATWNPIRARNTRTGRVGWHCEKISPGCQNCYAESMNRRLGTKLSYVPAGRSGLFLDGLFLDEKILTQPLRWQKPRRVFVCSMTDLFADFVPDEWIDRIFAVMALAPQHTFQLLTKRSKRMREWFHPGVWPDRVSDVMCAAEAMRTPGNDRVVVWDPRGDKHENYLCPHGDLSNRKRWPGWPLPNAWLIVSAEDQKRLDERVPDLLATPAVVRGVSAEPLLGSLSFTKWGTEGLKCTECPWVGAEEQAERDCSDPEDWGWLCPECDGVCAHVPMDEQLGEGLRWIIVGGESGPGAQPMHPDWPRAIRDQCADAGVPFFFKQWGEWAPKPHHHQSEGDIGLSPTGRVTAYASIHDPDAATMRRVGKTAAGAELDGRTWDEMPKAGTQEDIA